MNKIDNRVYNNKKAYPKRAIKQKAKTKHRQLTKVYLLKIGRGLDVEQDIVDYKRCADIWAYT